MKNMSFYVVKNACCDCFSVTKTPIIASQLVNVFSYKWSQTFAKLMSNTNNKMEYLFVFTA